jgi:hypothetical protein
MRRFLVLAGAWMALAVAAACAPGGGGTAPGGRTADGPRLTFREQVHHVGRISAGQKTEYRFAFTNTGNQLLEIKEIVPAPAEPGGCT